MAVGTPTAPRTTDRLRAYPPVALAVVAIVVAALVLPSALNLPQSNPSTVLEYAPVPPEDDDPPPPADGNLSSLGLGASNSLSQGAPPPPPPPPPDDGVGARPTDKRCVGNPPRQTEDPMSPPCVPFFDGDNFGATYNGVTRNEVKVLIYLDRGCPNFECAKDANTLEDLDQPAKPRCPKTWPSDNPNHDECDYPWIRTARAFSRYFNERFQTYGRRVHYWAYVTDQGDEAGRRADAAKHYAEIKPFAVIDQATYYGFNEAYQSSLAARGVLVFSQQTAMPNRFFRNSAPRAWGFWPDVEHWAEQYITYVCTKVKPYRVRRFGNPPGSAPENGQERVYGLWYTADSGEPGLRYFASLVKAGLRDCGITPAAEHTFPESGYTINASDSGAAATEAIAKFRETGVTTVLYLGGIEGRFSQHADAVRYYPEIVIAGDLENDNNITGRRQNQNVWQNVWGTQFHLRLDRPENTPAWQAYKQAYPDAPVEDAAFANEAYRDHFMLFQAIQVAGPRLTPESVDKGYHAIPEHRSSSPYVASCFFDANDYTCVKDSTEIWWDPTGTSPASSEPGCYRMVRDGSRFLAGEWPAGDDAFTNGADPCTGFERRIQIDPG